jgi:hypothetical protein
MKKELRLLLCPNVNAQYGAPMGRRQFWEPFAGVKHKHGDCIIPINSQGYDAGGAYWGIGNTLRCEYLVDGHTGALAGIRFYRGKKNSIMKGA